MVIDIVLQVVLILITVFMFLFMHDIPQKLLSKLRFKSPSNIQSKRHFVQGAQLLSQARSAADTSAAADLAKSAAEQADKAIALDPKDAASHILRSLSLEIQGFRTSALDSIDVALSPMAAKSLSNQERGDALFKRAEMKVAASGGERVDSAVADLVDSVRLRNDNPKAFCLLGECYEKKGMLEEARKAYEEALRVEPMTTPARQALDRLAS